jgi:hypothetical protein
MRDARTGQPLLTDSEAAQAEAQAAHREGEAAQLEAQRLRELLREKGLLE